MLEPSTPMHPQNASENRGENETFVKYVTYDKVSPDRLALVSGDGGVFSFWDVRAIAKNEFDAQAPPLLCCPSAEFVRVCAVQEEVLAMNDCDVLVRVVMPELP